MKHIFSTSNWTGRLRRGAALLSVGAFALLGTDAPAAHADQPPQPPMTCRPFVIISAYGTDESSVPADPWGNNNVNTWYIAGITKALKAQGIGQDPRVNGNPVPDPDVDIRNLPYPASILDPDYGSSVRQGADELVRELQWYGTHCGTKTSVILVGFSQGAQVVKAGLNEPGANDDLDLVAGVMNISDPTRVNPFDIGSGQEPGQTTLTPPSGSPPRFGVLDGMPSINDGGLLQRVGPPAALTDQSGGDARYFDVCRTDDKICDYPGTPRTVTDLAAAFADSAFFHTIHTSYGFADNGYIADWMGSRVVTAAMHHRSIVNPPPPGSGSPTCGPQAPAGALATAAINAACGQVAANTWYTWGGGHGVSPPRATYGHVDPSDPVRSQYDPTRKGFDCSGLVRYIFYKAAGYDIIGDTTANGNFHAPWQTRITPAQGVGALQPGDILFFGNSNYVHHTAIYIGDYYMIEAAESGTHVRINTLNAYSDYVGAVRVTGAGASGGPNSTWGTNVRLHTAPSVSAPVSGTLPGPTGIRIDCQEHAQSVTADGYTNDAWSHLPDLGGAWISNIYVKGASWLPGIPTCDGTGPATGTQSTWGTNVRVHAAPSVSAPVVATFVQPTSVTVTCQKHAESVTAAGYTNDAWSYLPDSGGWISNVFMKGAAWLAGVPTCDGGVAVGGGDHMTWGTDVAVHSAPSAASPQAAVLPGPTAVRISCQEHAQSVTASGYTNDAWSYLPDYHGWISNIFVKGAAWLTDVPVCQGGTTGGQENTGGTQFSTWGTNVNIRQDASSTSPPVATLSGPTTVTVQCQEHAQSVTASGYTNDVWSYLPDYHGWISNIFVKGTAWLPGIPVCLGNPPHVL